MSKKILAVVFMLCGSVTLANDLTLEELEAAHKECESDNMEACKALGIYYYNDGNDKVQAAEIAAKACEKNNLWFCTSAGEIYHELDEFIKSREYSSKVCGVQNLPSELQKAEAVACFRLGYLYSNGQGVRQDFQKTRELYTKACNGKYPGACYNLGTLYHNGEGVRQNLATAKEYYGKACDLGLQEGCDMYKRLNQAGH